MQNEQSRNILKILNSQLKINIKLIPNPGHFIRKLYQTFKKDIITILLRSQKIEAKITLSNTFYQTIILIPKADKNIVRKENCSKLPREYRSKYAQKNNNKLYPAKYNLFQQ